MSELSAQMPELAPKPALKWAGGKRWLAPRVRDIWQRCGGDARRLCEPFCGALGLALGVRPRRALLGDANPHLVNFHRAVQAGLQITIEMHNEAETYYAHREAFNALIEAGEALTPLGASYFWYLNRTGYNGLCRFNKRGRFNVPFGSYKTIRYRREFDDWKPALARWRFQCGDFADLRRRKSDFIYADPPYDTPFTSYSAGGFEWEAQERLAGWLAAHPGPVVASNSATPRILELYERHGFTIELVDGPRSISRNADGRVPAPEILATRNLPG